jgi:prolyl-tRNA synthetase
MSGGKALTPQSEDFSAWYNEVVQHAQLASHSPVRGCMVIRPYGYRIWELMQASLDGMFKDTGHENAYFPLFLPKSALDREAQHFEGFAPETAIVTHAGNAELEEPLVVRPTSEAIIWPILADWIHSYRDLPVLLNQWANVVRWEMRTRPFLRTTEFLWQEGHTAHATEADAEEETVRMLGVYRTFMEEWMAMPVITGLKTDSERFAGALRTYACEALMKDNKALQAGTSHNLGQNFARAFEVRYQTEEGEHEYVWSTSWGVSTRLVGALIMAHGDDAGLVLPPLLAPHQVVIVPIWRDGEQQQTVLAAAHRVGQTLSSAGVRLHLDDREGINPGAKYYEWERRGVPLRLEIGPRDVAAGVVMSVRRSVAEGAQRKVPLAEADLGTVVPAMLRDIQEHILQQARAHRERNTVWGVTDYAEFRQFMEEGGGFAYTGWCGSAECEQRVKDDTKSTVRVIPDEEFRSPDAPDVCLCGTDSLCQVVRARAY